MGVIHSAGSAAIFIVTVTVTVSSLPGVPPSSTSTSTSTFSRTSLPLFFRALKTLFISYYHPDRPTFWPSPTDSFAATQVRLSLTMADRPPKPSRKAGGTTGRGKGPAAQVPQVSYSTFCYHQSQSVDSFISCEIMLSDIGLSPSSMFCHLLTNV